MKLKVIKVLKFEELKVEKRGLGIGVSIKIVLLSC
jgi:hypothetical protein